MDDGGSGGWKDGGMDREKSLHKVFGTHITAL